MPLSLDDLLVPPALPVREALERMTRNHKGVLFVCGPERHLIGVLSDGDVRRSLLANTLLLAPVSKMMNPDPILATSVEEARVRLREHAAVAVPVVDAAGAVQAVAVQEGPEVQLLAPSVEPAGEPLPGGALAIIPARGGSKRLPGKNLAEAGGRSLVRRAVETARAAERVGAVLVSTDDPAIREAARAAGAQVPWLRPSELARDDTPTLPVLRHALEWARARPGGGPELAVLLEPTAPLRRPAQVDAALELLAAHPDADSVVTACRLPHVFHPEEVLRLDGGALRPYLPERSFATRRLRGAQDAAYVVSGAVYAFRVAPLLAGGDLFGRRCLPLETPWAEFLDVDEAADLARADAALRARAEETR